MEEMQPGQVIQPHNSTEPAAPSDGAPEPVRPPEVSQEPAPSPNASPEPSAPPEQINTPQFQPQIEALASYEAPQDDLSWTASEFIAHEKSAGWYGVLALGGVLLAAAIYWFTKDAITAGIILFAAIALGVFAARKPRTQQYALTSQGVHIGGKTYDFQAFKAFSVAPEGAITSIVFLPLKRFMPALTIYVAPEVEDQAIDYLADRLPVEPHKPDAIDSLLRRIHF